MSATVASGEHAPTTMFAALADETRWRILTRLGEGSRMMVNGDPSQIDLAPGQKSGLVDAVGLLRSIPRIGHVRFTHVDVVRHDLVRQIVEAYGRAGGEGQPNAAR